MKRTLAQLDKVHRAQEALARITGTVRGRTFYLAVHRRSASGQWSVRWRSMGVQGGHIAWSEIEDYFDRLSPQLKGWYRKINARAIFLNDEEQRVRASLRVTRGAARLGSSDEGEPD